MSPSPSNRPLVGVIMGSQSDWETMRHAVEHLDLLGIPHEVQVVSAHRTPDLMFDYAGSRFAKDTMWDEFLALLINAK